MKAKVNIQVGKAPSLHLFHTTCSWTVHGSLPKAYHKFTTFTGISWLKCDLAAWIRASEQTWEAQNILGQHATQPPTFFRVLGGILTNSGIA